MEVIAIGKLGKLRHGEHDGAEDRTRLLGQIRDGL